MRLAKKTRCFGTSFNDAKRLAMVAHRDIIRSAEARLFHVDMIGRILRLVDFCSQFEGNAARSLSVQNTKSSRGDEGRTRQQRRTSSKPAAGQKALPLLHCLPNRVRGGVVLDTDLAIGVLAGPS